MCDNNEIICECGSVIKRTSMRNHLKTKKHQKWVEERKKESEAQTRTLDLPENFWQMVEDRFESDLSFNSYTKNLDILKGEWHDTREFNGVEVTEDQVYDMEEAWRREFKEQMAEERRRGIASVDEEG